MSVAVADQKVELGIVEVSGAQSAWTRFPKAFRIPALCFASGLVLALSAPGLGQWYLAWCALAPLFLFIYSSKTVLQATARGIMFGLGYHMLFMNWYLGLHPVTWMGIDSDLISMVVASVCHLFESTHQTILIGLFAFVARFVPVSGGLSLWQDGKPRLPAALVLPALWIICYCKLGNDPGLAGVPWCMLEYTQYLQVPIIQIASVIGGSGLGALIVFVNVIAASAIATRFPGLGATALALPSRRVASVELIVAIAVIVGLYVAGSISASAKTFTPDVRVSCLQTDDVKVKRTGKHRNMVGIEQAMALLPSCKPGLCLWPAVPVNIVERDDFRNGLTTVAKRYHLDILIGGLSRGPNGRRAHSISSIDRNGTIGSDIYIKRYLVPISEYYPLFYRLIPEAIAAPFSKFLIGSEIFDAGTEPTVLPLPQGKVAPIICFETISPEMASASVKAGGDLLIDIGDRSWFHGATGWMMGEQMLSMCVLRAVENGRYFVFTSNTGPSACIEPTGKVVARAPFNKLQVFEATVQFLSEKTWFNRLF